MNGHSCHQGVMLWIDDALDVPARKDSPVWPRVFRGHHDRVFRLMDLSLQVATAVDEALALLDHFDQRRLLGTYVFVVLDLRIPRAKGETPLVKWGLSVACELRRRGYPFVILSARSDAAEDLNKSGLGAIPYYIKEGGDEPLGSLPDSLKAVILNEFRSNISWLNLRPLNSKLSPGSLCDVKEENGSGSPSVDLANVAFRMFPFFGPYRDFVEHSEYRTELELGRPIAIRAHAKHAPEFVQQALLILFASAILEANGPVHFSYVTSSQESRLQSYFRSDIKNPARAARIVGLDRDVNGDRLKELAGQLRHIAGTLVIVLPIDERCELLSDVLNDESIPIVCELPQDRVKTTNDRAMVVQHAASLVANLWMRASQVEMISESWRVGIQYPQLLVNPIDWHVLNSGSEEIEDISDPYECLREFSRSFRELQSRPKERKAIVECLQSGDPIPFAHMLLVGRDAWRGACAPSDWLDWLGGAIDCWLNSSWRVPYGLENIAGVVWASAEGAPDSTDAGVWRDSCYEILAGMLQEYSRGNASEQGQGQGACSLQFRPIEEFVAALGGPRFILTDGPAVDWQALEFLRWPHTRYPMPLAITTRLQAAGRFLWVQPDGLDLAAALPTGRMQHRRLTSVVEEYWEVIVWGRSVCESLPAGWNRAVEYLLETVRLREIGHRWKHDRLAFWDSLLALLRNGTPVLLIADRVLSGRPLVGEGDSAKKDLSCAKGYGTILGQVREGSRARRKWGYFSWPGSRQDADSSTSGPSAKARGQEGIDYRGEELLQSLKVVLERHGISKVRECGVENLLAALYEDEELRLYESWHGARVSYWNGEGEDRIPSFLTTKGDHLFRLIEHLTEVGHCLGRRRYVDGYHLLSVLNDIRVKGKDTPWPVSVEDMERVMELFVASLEGMIEQLAFCVSLAGFGDRAGPLRSSRLAMQLPDGVMPPSKEDLSAVLRVQDDAEGWAVYTLGIPGAASVDKLCYHSQGSVVSLDK